MSQITKRKLRRLNYRIPVQKALKAIAAIVTHYTDITLNEMRFGIRETRGAQRRQRRKRQAVIARWLVFMTAREMGFGTQKEIASFFKLKHHSSVIHGLKTGLQDLRQDESFRELYKDVREASRQRLGFAGKELKIPLTPGRDGLHMAICSYQQSDLTKTIDEILRDADQG